MLLLLFLPRPSPPPPAEGDGRFLARSRRLAAAASPRPCCRPLRPRDPGLLPPLHSPPAGPAASAPRFDLTLPGPAMADFDEIYEEEEDEERALEEQLLKYSPDPVVVRGSGHVTV